jgi:hypothetical protein
MSGEEAMLGTDAMQESLFTVSKLDDFVPMDHPLRAVRLLVNKVERSEIKRKVDGSASKSELNEN